MCGAFYDKEHGFFQPTRWRRLDDPLSSYLFPLCAVGFSALLKQAGESRAIRGIPFSRRTPAIDN